MTPKFSVTRFLGIKLKNGALNPLKPTISLQEKRVTKDTSKIIYDISQLGKNISSGKLKIYYPGNWPEDAAKKWLNQQ